MTTERWVKGTRLLYDWLPETQENKIKARFEEWVNVGLAWRIFQRRETIAAPGTYVEFDRYEMGPFEETPMHFLAVADAAGIARLERHFGEKK